jgi:hypothetical protein
VEIKCREWDSKTAFGTMAARYAKIQYGHTIRCSNFHSAPAAMGCAGLDAYLVSDLLAHLGREQFPAAMRRRGDSHMHRNMDGQRLADFKPGGVRASG